MGSDQAEVSIIVRPVNDEPPPAGGGVSALALGAGTSIVITGFQDDVAGLGDGTITSSGRLVGAYDLQVPEDGRPVNLTVNLDLNLDFSQTVLPVSLELAFPHPVASPGPDKTVPVLNTGTPIALPAIRFDPGTGTSFDLSGLLLSAVIDFDNTALAGDFGANAAFEYTLTGDGVGPGIGTAAQLLASLDPDGDGVLTASLSGSASVTAVPASPDLVVSSADLPDGVAGAAAGATFTVENRGGEVASGWTDRLYASTDPVLDSGDQLLGTLDQPGVLAAGDQIERTVPVTLPEDPGTYWLIVETDALDTVDEGSPPREDNNVTVAAAPTVVAAAYTASASASVETGVAGDPVTISGRAVSTVDGADVPSAPVTVALDRDGFVRTLEALTDADGNYQVDFASLPGEGGQFNVYAHHPRNPAEDSQPDDSFALIGLRFTDRDLAAAIHDGASRTFTLAIENISDIPLTGLSAVFDDLAAGWNADVAVTEAIAGDSSAEATLTVTVPADSDLRYETFDLRLTSDQGATATLPVAINVLPPRPDLVAEVARLEAGMLVGGQTFVELEIANIGGGKTGRINVLLPDADWLSLASATPIPSLASGETTTITLALRPGADLPPTLYSGSILFRADGDSLSVPFAFRAVSEARGDLELSVVDEFFFFSPDQPLVDDARVVILDAVTGAEVARNDDVDGTTVFRDLPEGYYTVDVSAGKHDSFRTTIFVDGGETEKLEAFLSRQSITYTWTVVETEIEDVYEIVIESTFETSVPVPVLTIVPNPIDLSSLDQLGEIMVVGFEITNHGLIAANDVALVFGSHRYYELSPAIPSLDRLNARSSAIIPVAIERIALEEPGDGFVPCGIPAALIWSYPAGGYTVGKSTPIFVQNVEGDCDPSPVPLPPPGRLDPATPLPPGVLTPTIFSSVPVIPEIKVCDPLAEVCVSVRIEIEQEAVLTRSAFVGTLVLSNPTETPITGIGIELDIRDQTGALAGTGVFGVSDPVLAGITAVDGTGVLAAGATGSAKFTFIPAPDAAPDGPAIYTIGGSLSFEDDGIPVEQPLAPAPVTVLPQPELILDYFHQRDVFADDPFTFAVEPSEPFALGLIVRNDGAGTAQNLRITSAQPEIVDNDSGLLIDFAIVGAQVGTDPVAPDLTVDLGDIAAGQTKVATWLLQSSLQGRFVDYDATFEHVNGLGNPDLSLIRDTNIHELTRIVMSELPDADGSPADDLPDFLVNDSLDAFGLPDALYFSDGGSAPVTVVTGATASNPVGGAVRTTTVTVNLVNGWNYIRLPDPAAGQFEVLGVTREDGTDVPAENTWRTDRTFPLQGRPTYEDILHLLDHADDATSATYTVTYRSSDVTGPRVAAINGIDGPWREFPLTAVDVVFSEPVDPASLDTADLSLTRDGLTIPLLDPLTVISIDATTLRISGLGLATADDGVYELTISATGVEDMAGNSGSGAVVETWTTSTEAPAVAGISGVEDELRNAPLGAVDVQFSQPVDPASVDAADLSLTRDGLAVDLSGVVAITALAADLYRIDGLSIVTAAEGEYALAVSAGGVTSPAGTAGLGGATVNWTLDATAPAITALGPVAPGSRNWPVAGIDLAFSEAIDPARFDPVAVTLTVDGVVVGDLEPIGLAVISPSEARLTGLDSLQSGDGDYVLTVNASAFRDLAGNALADPAAATWRLDQIAPTLVGPVAVSPDTGISATDGLVNTLALEVSGTVTDSDARVFVADAATGQLYGQAAMTGTAFTAAIDLSRAGWQVLELRIQDRVGNESTATVEVFADLARPAVERFVDVPETSTKPLDVIDLVLSEPIDPASFDRGDLTLSRDGGANLISTGVSVTALTDTLYRIEGLGSATAAGGEFTLAVDAAGIADRAGNAGVGVAEVVFEVIPELVAVPDVAVTTQARPVTIDVLANDRTGGLEPTPELVGQPAGGLAFVGADGDIRYLPDAGFVGTDTFDYQIFNTTGDSATATVTVTVTAPATPPVQGGAGNSVLFAPAEGGVIDGGAGADRLLGGNGDDVLSGGDDRDLLVGGTGNDVLDGGSDQDILFGGSGADTFILSATDAFDLIRDFSAAEGDRVQLAIPSLLTPDGQLDISRLGARDGLGDLILEVDVGAGFVPIANLTQAAGLDLELVIDGLFV